MTIAEKIARAKTDYDEVYEAGYAKGQAGGGDTTAAYDEGFEAGKKAEHVAFWGAYQASGLQTNCDFMFAGQGWTTKYMVPIHDVKPNRANNMFSLCAFTGDLAQHFEDLGITLDFSNCTMVQGIFSNAFLITRLGIVDFRKVTYGSSWFINMTGLITIDKLLISEGTSAPGASFESCSKLVNLTIEGVINKNGYNFQWSKNLSHESLMSIINALKDFSGTDTWMSITLGADNIAKLTESELAIMTNKQWNYK